MARESFDPMEALKSVLEAFDVHKRDRDGRRFFGFASFVYGHLFKKSLSASKLEELQQGFPEANLYFSHFVKLHGSKSINKESLLLLMARGAGVLCANNQGSVQVAANIFLPSATKLSTSNMGSMLYQVKNDPHYSDTTRPELTESMRP